MTGPVTPPPGEPHRVRKQKSDGFAQSVAFSAARGALLIGVAVIIGIVLLQVVDNDTTGPIGDGGSSAGAATNSTTTTTAPAAGGSTSTTAPAAASATKQPGEISVQVLNGSGVHGAAGTLTTKLKSAGYVTLAPNDTTSVKGTTVYCTGGLDKEAAALAAAVGSTPPPTAAALPSPAPSGTDPSANCVVVVGS